jgi:DnaJ-class molecular chaperone
MSADDDRDFDQMAPGDEAPPGTEGTGEDVCPRCGGDGRLDGGDCPECEGTGTVIRGVSGG